MEKTTLLAEKNCHFTTKNNIIYIVFSILLFFVTIHVKAQTQVIPQVNFSQRTSSASPAQKIYNIKGDFILIGNTNLSLANYSNTTNNQRNTMEYIDIDGDPATLNSSTATLELSNSGENGANQNCSNVLFAALYWTGKSDDLDSFTAASKQVQSGTKTINDNLTVIDNQYIVNTNYNLNITRNNPSNNNRSPIYTFSGNGNTYVFKYTNNAAPNTVTLSINGGAATNVPVNIIVLGTTATATLTTPYSIVDGTTTLTINQLIRNTATNLSPANTRNSSSATVIVSGTVPTYTTLTKVYDKKVVSLKGPGDAAYITITAKPNGVNSDIWFPGAAQSGIFVGYQEITDYVKAHGTGAYTVADIALKEGIDASPGYSGGWGMVVIYSNPMMKSRAVTLFDGYANINGQANRGQYGLIPISGFTTVGSGPVNMKLGVMASEGDVALTGDYLAVQKLNADPTVYPANYLVLSHSGNSTTNFFNSSIFPFPAAGNSIPNLVNNTGVDFSMYTIPNAGNSIIANNQTSTTFRFGSNSDIYTIFGFAMSVDAYLPEPKGLISVNSINNITNPPILNALPGQTINYSLDITNEGTDATNNTIISIPIPTTSIFITGTIVYHTYHGFTPNTAPYFDPMLNKIIWELGTLPITPGYPEYIYADVSFDLDVTTDCDIILNAGCNPVVSLDAGNITGQGAISGITFTKNFFQGYDTSDCHLPIEGAIQVTIDKSLCLVGMAGPDQISACGGDNVTLAANSGTTGSWSIISGPSGGGEIFSDSTSPTSEFYSPNIGIYTLRWTTSCDNTDEALITLSLCNVVNFDGNDDNVNFKNNFNLNSGNFSIEAWIKPNTTNENTQTILSKHLSPTSTDGYDLRLVNNFVSFNWNNNSLIATHAIDTNRWYHIAVTFDGTNYQLYIDGILDNTATGANPTGNNVDFILGAMSQNKSIPHNFYNGYADELRIWNTCLTVDQIRQTMNQEITDDGNGNVKGVIIPKNISDLGWANLLGYYQMNRASDINNGYLVDKSGNSKNGKLKGIYIQEPDTAPIPYTSVADGDWETDNTWTNYPVWDVPNSIGIDNTTRIDWNIVETSHNISSNGNKTVLGLLVDSNTLTAANDSKIEVSSYLKLDGKIDLQGKSQLIQTINSDLEVTSAGYIERDQQGQSNKFNYNYWSSPVGSINTTSNNNSFTVAGIMKDGTYPENIQDIVWTSGYDGSPTNPITLSTYWINKFQNLTPIYANWTRVSQTGTLLPAQGFTLKGSGAATETQNYTFVGKPNNGNITSTIAANNINLCGNPYASALDSYAFINANIDSITGTLYFWEHYNTNSSHVLAQYQGGYATRNLVGGTAAVAPAGISGLGSSNRVPGRYIPVGQGFILYGSSTGGIINFDNSQRAFIKEYDETNPNPLFRKSASTVVENKFNNKNDVIPSKTEFPKIRLGFTAANNLQRQLLLGFMDKNATSGIDTGYDANMIDVQPNDMYFLNTNTKLVIQGDGYFNTSNVYPLGVVTAVEGNVKFNLDNLEEFDSNQNIYIFDNVTNLYHDIRKEAFEIYLPVGTVNNRFSLRFKNTAAIEENILVSNENIMVAFTKNDKMINVINNAIDTKVKSVILFNILGQFLNAWEVKNEDQAKIKIPVYNISSGTYIVKVQTSKGHINKKIIIN